MRPPTEAASCRAGLWTTSDPYLLQTRRLQEPFQRVSTQRQFWATMIVVLADQARTGVALFGCVAASDVPTNPTVKASTVAASSTRIYGVSKFAMTVIIRISNRKEPALNAKGTTDLGPDGKGPVPN